MVRLTRWACANVDYITLCSSNVFVLHLQGNGLDKNSILGPGLEVLNADFWVSVFILREIYIHHVPAVWATAILAVKLCDVLKRTGKEKEERICLLLSKIILNLISKTHSWLCLKIGLILKDLLGHYLQMWYIYHIIATPYNFWLITHIQASHFFHYVSKIWQVIKPRHFKQWAERDAVCKSGCLLSIRGILLLIIWNLSASKGGNQSKYAKPDSFPCVSETPFLTFKKIKKTFNNTHSALLYSSYSSSL